MQEDAAKRAGMIVCCLCVRVCCMQVFDWAVADGTYTAGHNTSGAFTADSTLYCADERGVGADNPSDPMNLTSLEVSRSVFIEVNDVASVSVRYLLRNGPSTSGRNFLIGGRPVHDEAV